MLLDTDVINGILKEELGAEKYQGWVEGQRLFKAITRYHCELFEERYEPDAGQADQESINKYSLGRSLSPGVMCASEVQRLRDQERINAMSGKLKNKLACETDPGDYAPTSGYAKHERAYTWPPGIMVGVDKVQKDHAAWVDQEYLEGLVKEDQRKDQSAWEAAKKIQEKFGGQDETK